MPHSIQNDIEELLREGLIDQATGDAISQYYQQKPKPDNSSRLNLAFGILGATLVGLGIILIVAHNWDNLSRQVKTVFALLPAIIGQAACCYALMKRNDSPMWKEGASVFLVFALGAGIALISQIYNLPGSMDSFFLTWSLMVLPLIYVMNSSFTGLLFLMGINLYRVNHNLPRNEVSLETLWYWLPLLAALPHYIQLLRQKPNSNIIAFFNWILAIGFLFAIVGRIGSQEWLVPLIFCAIFSSLYILGQLPTFKRSSLVRNAYQAIGSLGSIGLILVLSFEDVWEGIAKEFNQTEALALFPEMIIACLAVPCLLVLFYLWYKRSKETSLTPIMYIPIALIPLFFIGLYTTAVFYAINILVLVVGISTVWRGAKADNLGLMNFGLLIVAALASVRFADDSLSFVIRGILFMLVGIGFFATNYWLIKRRKAHES